LFRVPGRASFLASLEDAGLGGLDGCPKVEFDLPEPTPSLRLVIPFCHLITARDVNEINANIANQCQPVPRGSLQEVYASLRKLETGL
jgi:hypothetical protein